MRLTPISFKEACDFVNSIHRHHKKPQGHKFSIGCSVDDELVGVVIVGRPVSRHRDDGVTLEITRLCTNGYKNACSFLYSAAARVAKNLGYNKIITYILESELGKSLEASGFSFEYSNRGGTWNRVTRTRVDTHPTVPKKCYSKTLL